MSVYATNKYAGINAGIGRGETGGRAYGEILLHP